jgi:hypothetical protein
MLVAPHKTAVIMDIHETMQELYEHVRRTRHQIEEPRFTTEHSLHVNADLIIRYAETLKAAKEERLAGLKADGPRVFYDHDEMYIVLLRDGDEKYVMCTEGTAVVQRTNDSTLLVELHLQDTPAHTDGYTYFLRLLPWDYGVRDCGIWLSYEEAIILKTRISEALATAE